MTSADAAHWDARYADTAPPEPKRPEALSEEFTHLIPPSGTALDVACGAGSVSSWLAGRGLAVTAVDVSASAAALTAAATEAAGVDELVDVVVRDLDDGFPTSMNAYDVIVCQRFRNTDLYDVFVDRLNLGGIAIVTVLSATGTSSPGRHHAPSAELADAFDRSDCEVLRHVEAAGVESIIVRRIA